MTGFDQDISKYGFHEKISLASRPRFRFACRFAPPHLRKLPEHSLGTRRGVAGTLGHQLQAPDDEARVPQQRRATAHKCGLVAGQMWY
eukprot:2853193-Pleurochrysis_carterae.AAC.4